MVLAAVGALGEMGAAAAPRVSCQVARLLSVHQDEQVLAAAAEALGKMRSAEHAADLAGLLAQGQRIPVLAAAVKALGGIGWVAAREEQRLRGIRLDAQPRAQAVARALACHQGDVPLRAAAATTFGMLGMAKEVLELFADPEPQVRLAAARALAEMGPSARTRAEDVFCRLLGEADADVLRQGCDAFAVLGGSPVLRSALHLSSLDDRMRQAGQHALKGLGPTEARPIVELLHTAKENRMFLAAVETLGATGNPAFANLIVSRLRAMGGNTRSAAEAALSKLGACGAAHLAAFRVMDPCDATVRDAGLAQLKAMEQSATDHHEAVVLTAEAVGKDLDDPQSYDFSCKESVLALVCMGTEGRQTLSDLLRERPDWMCRKVRRLEEKLRSGATDRLRALLRESLTSASR